MQPCRNITCQEEEAKTDSQSHRAGAPHSKEGFKDAFPNKMEFYLQLQVKFDTILKQGSRRIE